MNKPILLLALCCILRVFIIVPATIAAPASKAANQTVKTKPASKKTASSLIVQGKIKEIAKTPRPGSVPYKDAVTAIHLTRVKSIQGKLKQNSILVYVWGMRANKLTSMASYRVGQSIKISLKPWAKMEGKYGRYQRMELDSEEALSLDSFWGEVTK
ncbi:MAG TPA: hypothetical protein VGB77_03965 [Abditibacteriaceae bacterium]|jgi:hypothetical protein